MEQKVKNLEEEVSKRKLSEEAQQASERNYREIFNATNDAIIVHDMATGKIVDVNNRLCELLGYSYQEVKNLTVKDLSYGKPPYTENEAEQWIKKAVEEGPQLFEWLARKSSGELIWLEINLKRAVIGGKDRILAVDREITERKSAQEALRESEGKYRDLYDKAPDMFVSVDSKTANIIECNQTLANALGYIKEEIIGRPIFDVYAPDSAKRAREVLFPLFVKTGSIQGEELQLQRKDGSTIEVSLNASAVRDDQGNIIHSRSIWRDITERKRIEEALRESEETLKSIFRAAPIGIGLVSARVIKQANDRLCEMVGCSRDELLGQSARMLYPTDKEFEYVGQEKYAQITKFGTGTVETCWKRKDGKLIDVLLSSTPIDPNDLSIGVTFTALDITERKQAEEALRESEEQLREAQDIARLGRWELDFTTNRLHWSDSIFQLFEIDREKFGASYEAFLEVIHPSDRELVNRVYTESLKDRTPYEITHRLHMKDGRVKWVNEICRTDYDDQGRPVRSVGTVQDITERKQAEEALRESEEKYRTVLEANPDPVVVYDMEGKVIYFNPAFTGVFGWTLEERLGEKMDVFVPEEAWRETKVMIEKVLAGQRFSGIETRRYNKKGEIVPVSISGAIYRNRDGHPLGSVINLRDISEQKRLETQFQAAQKMEAIGTLAGGIAHDFNNLLMGIQGRTSLMLNDINSSLHPHIEHLKGIEAYIKSATNLTKQLLGFARGGKYEVKPTDLNEIVTRGSELFGRTNKEISIHRKIHRGLWTVEVDQSQIEQIMLNLYVNAWQSMPGGGELYLETENILLDDGFVKPYELRPGKYVKISVTDTGVGMDKATLARVFDPFFTTKEMGRGFGLGLASAYGIIKNHGGIINVYSEKGKGATFNIYLPASEKAVVKEKELSKDILKGVETILLVDDEEMIIDVARELLKKLGYKVLAAKGGKAAVELYDANKDEIDMVILDMIMPHMGGGDTYDMLKAINPNIKVLLSSGYSINGQATEIIKRGCNGFIQKPFNMRGLTQKLRGILDKE
ncbi:MAG: PAS domain S-box protein [Proteobacteria bacterium]|nr:PAS domain S-box protein [Pseudomonadota bacterium]